jgi:hypothetical protein
MAAEKCSSALRLFADISFVIEPNYEFVSGWDSAAGSFAIHMPMLKLRIAWCFVSYTGLCCRASVYLLIAC